jgi:hypothetical protein
MRQPFEGTLAMEKALDPEFKRHLDTWNSFIRGSVYIGGFVILVLVLLAIFVV